MPESIKEPITLNHLSELIRILNDKFYSHHTFIFDLSNEDEVYDTLSKLTDKQYNYLIHLLSVGRWLEIKKILSNYLKLK